VGLAAIQIVNSLGAKPIALTRTGAKRQALLEAGAAHVVATEEQDLVAAVKKLTRGKGARLVFDPVAGPTLAKLAAATKERGIIFQYGALSSEPTLLPLMDVLGKSLTVRGYILFEITGNPRRLEKAKRFIVDGLASGKLKPVIAKTFSGLDSIVEAHRYLESNQQVGKIVVTL
jgi:NADPH:quinone reductase-like Zn-dependent oxidoreductase